MGVRLEQFNEKLENKLDDLIWKLKNIDGGDVFVGIMFFIFCILIPFALGNALFQSIKIEHTKDEIVDYLYTEFNYEAGSLDYDDLAIFIDDTNTLHIGNGLYIREYKIFPEQLEDLREFFEIIN